MKTIWLASYPKSGNTWMRMLLAALALKEGESLNINDLPEYGGIASAREPFEHATMIDSSLLTHDEIDNLRPAVYRALWSAPDNDAGSSGFARFVKTHDAYTHLTNGVPLLAGRDGADAAVLIVRDPRDVAVSFANHSNTPIDKTIARMASAEHCFCDDTDRFANQLRQKLLGWSSYNASWLDQGDLPLLPIRYEDMKADTAQALSAVLTFSECTVDPERIAHAVAAADFALLAQQEQTAGFREAPRKMTSGRFFRRGESGSWHKELTRAQVRRIERDHGSMMQRLGYYLQAVGNEEGTAA